MTRLLRYLLWLDVQAAGARHRPDFSPMDD